MMHEWHPGQGWEERQHRVGVGVAAKDHRLSPCRNRAERMQPFGSEDSTTCVSLEIPEAPER